MVGGIQERRSGGGEAIEDDLTEIDVGEERAWIVSSPDVIEPEGTPTVRLLTMYAAASSATGIATWSSPTSTPTGCNPVVP